MVWYDLRVKRDKLNMYVINPKASTKINKNEVIAN